MLRGMGFNNKTAIFLASGKIYKSEKTMAPLLEMFPLLQTKETLASDEELAPFKVWVRSAIYKLLWNLWVLLLMTHCWQNFSSRMAAIDYSVCAYSEVFVTTQGGNFPHFLMGHRRYLYGGHSKTIKPDKRRLAILFDNPRIGYDIAPNLVFLISDLKHLHLIFFIYSPYSCLLIFLQMEDIETALAQYESTQRCQRG
jgi:hypothetical protein